MTGEQITFDGDDSRYGRWRRSPCSSSDYSIYYRATSKTAPASATVFHHRHPRGAPWMLYHRPTDRASEHRTLADAKREAMWLDFRYRALGKDAVRVPVDVEAALHPFTPPPPPEPAPPRPAVRRGLLWRILHPREPHTLEAIEWPHWDDEAKRIRLPETATSQPSDESTLVD